MVARSNDCPMGQPREGKLRIITAIIRIKIIIKRERKKRSRRKQEKYYRPSIIIKMTTIIIRGTVIIVSGSNRSNGFLMPLLL